MSGTRRRGPAREAASAALAALLVLTLTSCTTAGPHSGPPATAAPGATSPSGGVPADVEVTPEMWASARQRAVTELLRARFAAAERSDESGWLAPLQGASSAALRPTQAAVLDRMTRMAVESLRLVGVRETTAPVPAARGTTVEWDVRASLTYRLRGFDARPRSFDLDLTFKADPSRPAGLVITASAPSGRPQPWDLAGLVVRRSHTALVLGVGDDDRIEEVVRRARTAASRVASVWGEVRPAVWIAPATDVDAARLLGRTAGDLDGVAAATDGPLTPGERAGADRIVLVPGAWASLRPDGRDVVMTHELTHVTVRASTTRAVPVWLSEGFAELVAYEPIDLPEATIVAPALERVRASGLPQALPADADFDPGTHALAAAYGLSLLALRTLADAHGTQAVVRLYRAAAGGLDVPTSRLDDREAAVDAALRSTTGTTRAALVTDWQARIRDLLR
ncbi:hypothetical protein AB4Z14_15195 [Terrabacter sp. 2TAF16]|uniref:hypothetical protein n=1 Tax=Terrabacter sp. 2TAF16 TaxID=3233008 RepID=UPI003F99D584